MRVKATREGLMGQVTASGYIVDDVVPFVALPCGDALNCFVRVTNPLNGRTTLAIVLDVGPWNTHDHRYVMEGQRPQAESGTDMYGRTTNGAGIDLSESVWKRLRMVDNTEVEWEFM